MGEGAGAGAGLRVRWMVCLLVFVVLVGEAVRRRVVFVGWLL